MKGINMMHRVKCAYCGKEETVCVPDDMIGCAVTCSDYCRRQYAYRRKQKYSMKGKNNEVINKEN